MFDNLEAEQARKRKTDKEIAELLGLTRETYCKKKKTKDFRFSEIQNLCSYFECDFAYLFAEKPQ